MGGKERIMHGYFSGLYLKCQSPKQTLSVIPAVHGGSRSVQLITDSGAWSVTGCPAALGRDGFALDFQTDRASFEFEY